MNDASVQLSIIIVAYKSMRVIDACLYSIFQNNDLTDSQLEVIVVDNSPEGDPSYNHIKKNFPRVVLVKNEKNGGFGQGNNMGVHLAKSECILFLNPDTIVLEPFFKKMSQNLSKDKSVIAIGCRLVDSKGRMVSSFGKMPERLNVLSTDFFHKIRLKFGDVVISGSYPWGACLGVRKADFFHAGKFDEKLFLNYEEPDLIQRLSKTLNSRRIKILNKKVVHLEGDAKSNSPANEYAKASETYYFSKFDFDYDRFKNVLRKREILRAFVRMFFSFSFRSQEQ